MNTLKVKNKYMPNGKRHVLNSHDKNKRRNTEYTEIPPRTPIGLTQWNKIANMKPITKTPLITTKFGKVSILKSNTQLEKFKTHNI